MTGEVLIAGGGIGGLAAALALARIGVTSHVIEKRIIAPEATASEEGAGIQIGPNGTRILTELGVTPTLAPVAGRPEAILVRDTRTARVLARLPLGAWIAARHGSPYWVLHRADLHRALRARVSQEALIEVTGGAEIAEATTSDAGVTVTAADGRTWTARAMIAADGLRSPIRRSVIAPEVRLQFAGKSAVRSVIPRSDVPERFREAVTGLWLGPSCHVVHYPVRGGDEMAIVIILRDGANDESWGAPVTPEWVKANMTGVAPELASLVASATSWRRWALSIAPEPRTMARGPMALLGDAAHPVLPFLAQGAVMALEDAVVLAREWARAPNDPVHAFRYYEQERLPRVRRVAAASARNGQIYHMTGLMAAARDFTLALSPPERLMAGYDWLYGWRA